MAVGSRFPVDDHVEVPFGADDILLLRTNGNQVGLLSTDEINNTWHIFITYIRRQYTSLCFGKNGLEILVKL